MAIRPERSIEQYSRGLKLVKTIHRMWDLNDRERPYMPWPTSQIINPRIEEIIMVFDLTVEEWHYWCKQAAAANGWIYQTPGER
jgi:hypothetical protein